MTMSFVVVFPARTARPAFRAKPLADLGGKPMIVRVAERAAQKRAREKSWSPPITPT